MNGSRIRCLIPLAAAVALSVGACQTPWTAGSNAAATSSATANTMASGAASTATRPGAPAPGDGSAAADGMSPEDVGQYCRLSGAFSAMGPPEQLSAFYFGEAAKPLVDLKKHTPARLQPDVDLLYRDYQSLAKEERVFAQLRDEIDASYKRVMDFRGQICEVH